MALRIDIPGLLVPDGHPAMRTELFGGLCVVVTEGSRLEGMAMLRYQGHMIPEDLNWSMHDTTCLPAEASHHTGLPVLAQTSLARLMCRCSRSGLCVCVADGILGPAACGFGCGFRRS